MFNNSNTLTSLFILQSKIIHGRYYLGIAYHINHLHICITGANIKQALHLPTQPYTVYSANLYSRDDFKPIQYRIIYTVCFHGFLYKNVINALHFLYQPLPQIFSHFKGNCNPKIDVCENVIPVFYCLQFWTNEVKTSGQSC